MYNIIYVENTSVMAIGREDTIKLSGGMSLNEGRVDIFLHGHWGTVCDYNWDLLDAIVACRQLGYSTAEVALTGSAIGTGSGPNLMNSMRCTGYEGNLFECNHGLGYDSCQNHAGVICSSKLIETDVLVFSRRMDD